MHRRIASVADRSDINRWRVCCKIITLPIIVTIFESMSLSLSGSSSTIMILLHTRFSCCDRHFSTSWRNVLRLGLLRYINGKLLLRERRDDDVNANRSEDILNSFAGIQQVTHIPRTEILEPWIKLITRSEQGLDNVCVDAPDIMFDNRLVMWKLSLVHPTSTILTPAAGN